MGILVNEYYLLLNPVNLMNLLRIALVLQLSIINFGCKVEENEFEHFFSSFLQPGPTLSFSNLGYEEEWKVKTYSWIHFGSEDIITTTTEIYNTPPIHLFLHILKAFSLV